MVLRASKALLILLCLVLGMGMPALWVRSYFVHDALDWDMKGGRAGMFSAHGRLGLGRLIAPPAALARSPHGLQYWHDRSGSAELKPSWSSWTGLQVTYVAQPGFTASDVRIPYWMLMLAAATPVAFWMYRRLRRPPPGYCGACGYDLRASVGRCPECGSTIEGHG